MEDKNKTTIAREFLKRKAMELNSLVLDFRKQFFDCSLYESYVEGNFYDALVAELIASELLEIVRNPAVNTSKLIDDEIQRHTDLDFHSDHYTITQRKHAGVAHILKECKKFAFTVQE